MDEFTANDKPVKDYLSPTHQVINLNSDNEDDTCLIKISDENIRVRWGKINVDFEQLGQKKNEYRSGLLISSYMQLDDLTDTGGLIGMEGENVILYLNKGTFTQTSLNFSGTFTLNPYTLNSSQVLQSIVLTKRPNVQYPMINGILDWPQLDTLKDVDPSMGFMILGCILT